MRKRVKIALAVLLVAMVGVVGWQVLRPQEREPVYQGKGLRVWLSEYCYARARQDARGQDIAESGVRQIGTNAIPTLLRMLGKKDSRVVSKMRHLWGEHIQDLPYFPGEVLHPNWFENSAHLLNGEAVVGFEILGTNAQEAVPALMTIYERDISFRSQAATGSALNAIGPEAQRMAIPLFLRGAVGSNAQARIVAIWGLSKVRVEPQIVVPALAKFLSNTDFAMRMAAAQGLGHFGTNAQQAVPALVPLLSDPDAFVRSATTDALKAIDPEAAAKAGVK